MRNYYFFASVFSNLERTYYTQDPLNRTSILCEVKGSGLLIEAAKCFVESKWFCDLYSNNCNWNNNHSIHLYCLDEQGKAVCFNEMIEL